MNIRIIVCGAAAILLGGCETTGDPTQGGLFGWSEGKARQRQVALHDAVSLEHDRTSDARAESGQLRAQRSRNASAISAERARLTRMERQLDEVERAGGGGRTTALRSRIQRTRSDSSLDDAALRARTRELDSEVRSLRQEYGLLQQRR